MKVLIVAPPLTGHVNPLAAVATALVADGHAVRWVGHAPVLRPLLPADATIVDVTGHLGAGEVDALHAKGRGLRGAAAFKFLWDDLFWPLADAMVPYVDGAIAAWAPDVVLTDQQALAGPIGAARHGLPWVTSAGTSASLVDPLDALPQLKQWMRDGTTALAARHGVDAPDGELLSASAVLVFSTPALVGPGPFPDAWHFVGPVIAPRPDVPFPWEALRDDRPTVLVSLGTVSAEQGGRFFAAAAEAMRARGVQGVFVASPDHLPDPPPDAIVQAYVPQLALLPRVDAVVCHAGHNTVVEALWHDLPLVVAPIRDDQPVVAHQVVTAGAGVRVKFGRVRADALGEALDAALGDPAIREAAAAIGASFRAAGGAVAAAEVIAGVASR